MSPDQWIITLAGIAGIAGVIWYFFLSSAEAATASGSGVQRFRIEVNNAYSPAAVRVRAGAPVRLDFHRVDRSSCTEEVVVPDFGIRVFLPTGKTTSVEFTPRKPGTYGFACGMGMVHGRVIVEQDAN